MAKFNVEKITLVLALIGAVNWGLATLGYNIVNMIAGAVWPALENIIYYVVGASGIYQLYLMFK